MKYNIILQGDALSKLKELPNKSVNMCLTSPPYWALRDYGTAHWKGGDDKCNHSTEHTSPKSTLGGGKTTQNVASFYKDFCKRCGAKRIDKQLGLEKTFDEYINNLCNVFDEVKRVLRDDGTCWVNIGDTYGGSGQHSNEHPEWKGKQNESDKVFYPNNNLKGKIMHKSLIMIPFRFAIEMVNRGWILRNTLIWHKPNAMPSSVKDRFTVDFEYVFLFSKKQKYYFEQQTEPSEYEERNKRAVWAINPKGFKEAHFAVFPEQLCETPIKAGCPKGGIVLDPFFGSGTTGVVALKQSKKFIGIELNPEYIKLAKKRLKPHLEQTKLNIILK